MLQKYNKAMDRICWAIKYFLAAVIAATILISFVEVVRRYLFGQAFTWSDEFQRFAMVYIGTIGGAASYHYGELVGFDTVLNRFGPKGKFVIEMISDLLSLVLIVICLILSVQTVMSKSVQIAISTGLKIPMTIPYAAFVIGFFLMALFCIGKIANRIADRKSAALEKEED